MGGTGKTTLAREVGKELKQSGQFTHVIVTTVSFTHDLKKIQDEIAGPLGLKFENCNESDRPGKLWNRLTNGEKILLIMDDMWDENPPDFDAIGIPKQDNHKGCRVLVTTRSKQVFKDINFSISIELELLSEKDAWSMFKTYAGISKSSSNNVIRKAREIAKECKQLPVAIAVTAGSLKGQQQRVHEWDVALKSLKNPASMQGVNADMVGIYNCLKFSYDYMKDEKAKRLFLLCSVFPEDKEISNEVLARLCIGAGIFGENHDENHDIYDAARDQVFVAKDRLVDSCLLLEVDKKHVKMHDLIRDVGQWIAKKEIQELNLSNKNQKLLVERETNIMCVSCKGKGMDLFSCKFADGSKLETLIVIVDRDGHYEGPEVPNSFFENIVKLRVLYFLGDYGLSLPLPNSIQSLSNIRSVLVHKLNLGDISVLGNLQSLETLDLDNCTINELPNEITKLEEFKLLNLNDCEIEKNNPFEVIERCSSLEELYFIDSFNDFCREITLPELQRYRIHEGSFYKAEFNDIMEDSLKYVVLKGDADKEYYFSRRTLKFCMNDLVVLCLRYDSHLQCLIDTKLDDSEVPIVFSQLVSLDLMDMKNLEELCTGPISLVSLNNLEELFISSNFSKPTIVGDLDNI
ncbi:CC-NBS-LRR resistance protein [Trifolium medium]|uniref:CC-NBS-LRR resistance protein n=1 Tax=Trifolium medium TaxID=97028 RepID=A0A392LX64_9FABA|nr:CC-NBS-LRR resistance protein [Trifolium medium]